MKKKNIVYLIFTIIVLLPLWMWVFWLLTPQTKMVGAILDKSVLTKKGQEHVSLTWMLNYKKLTKTSNKPYTTAHDYFGFFPGENEKFRLKGLERFSEKQLKKISVDADFVYFTDTYGVYKNEWFVNDVVKPQFGKLYGGLSDQDLSFLSHMKQKNKLIVTEFNTMASPTSRTNRRSFENLFGLHWNGWAGRYFDSFDTIVNKELPKWLVRNYKRDHGGVWDFKKSGIMLVDERGKIVVLEDSLDLNIDLPHIVTSKKGQERFGLPEDIKYSFWFDIISVNDSVNDVVSSYKLDVNANGSEKLKKVGLPSVFPAVTMHKKEQGRFYYFSGDFCDNPISISSSYFKGIHLFKWLYYDMENPMERSSFFWEFYYPLMDRILDEEEAYLR